MSRTVRFRTTIQQRGVNPYVDVPERVSRAFAAFAKAGRIRIDGKLNSTSIRGNLLPIRGGGHRLYLNGGMRTAAHVNVGDDIALELRAMSPDAASLPADVAAALEKTREAHHAFKRLAPSTQREMVRYVDDARTPANRTRRIARLVEHVAGTPQPAGPPAASPRPLWTCPKCGNLFVTRNMYHSCARHEVSDAFEGKPPRIRELFDAFRKIVEGCGPVSVVAYRDRVGFMARVRFAGATPRQKALDVAFWLRRRFAHPRFRRVETLYPDAHIYSIRITDSSDFDGELTAWIEEAYRVGCQDR